MILSVIIVNYNVKYFLEQSLRSVLAAAVATRIEVIVIDNNSEDNSLAYLRPLFPEVIFVANEQNIGFAKACNQGLARARGKYILFLNPDTIVPEDIFSRCINFLERRPDAGALGVRMIDGRGRFLRESKRAFPSPLTAFYKLTGLARMFPRSPVFSRYHLGHLDASIDQQVDVLSGAFLMIPRAVLDITGGFDETFFMYGEDIDLTYRIQEAGFKNYYFAGASIIHFKGESTRKASANYVRMFYQAMSLFVKKHYGKTRARVFNFSIQLAIGLRAVLSAFGRFIRFIGMPIIDAALILLSFFLAKKCWSAWVKTNTDYDAVLIWSSFATLSLLYLVIAYYAGLYDRWYKTGNLWKTALAGTLLVLALYSLLPESFRFSRGIILLGSVFSFLTIAVFRRILIYSGIIPIGTSSSTGMALVVGSAKEYREVEQLLRHSPGITTANILQALKREQGNEAFWKNMKEVISRRTPATRDLIYCVGEMPVKELIDHMQAIGKTLSIRVHYSGSGSMVGSDSTNRSGDAFSPDDRYRITKPFYRRWKRLVDLGIAVVSFVFFPVQFLIVRQPGSFLRNCLEVMVGRKTWVGYMGNGDGLPALRPAIISPAGSRAGAACTPNGSYEEVLDSNYAEKYDPYTDLQLICRWYRNLGN
ncbi:MAG: glycosyltransferase family 2 protein [Chitinophagaceae bacterium]